MLVEALPVVAHHRDDRAIQQPFPLEELHDPSELRIHEGDLAVVRPAAYSVLNGSGGSYGVWGS